MRMAPSLVLLALAACDGRAATGIPTSRDGAGLVGRDVRALLPDRWASEASVDPAGGPRATLVRFWTDGCPFCRASLPAVEALRREYGPRGLATVGVFHPKPRGEVADGVALSVARELGYGGPVAVDAEWEALAAIRPVAAAGGPTSYSVLLDDEGIVRFVHPGPEFHPSDDPEHALCDADFRDLARAIEVLLEADR